MEYIRRIAWTGTELARAQVTTVRFKLPKIGTVTSRNTRRVRLLFSSAYPRKQHLANMLALPTCSVASSWPVAVLSPAPKKTTGITGSAPEPRYRGKKHGKIIATDPV